MTREPGDRPARHSRTCRWDRRGGLDGFCLEGRVRLWRVRVSARAPARLAPWRCGSVRRDARSWRRGPGRRARGGRRRHGPNGSGKSTLLRCLYAWHVPAGGAVLLDGADVLTVDPLVRAQAVAVLASTGGRAGPHGRGGGGAGAPAASARMGPGGCGGCGGGGGGAGRGGARVTGGTGPSRRCPAGRSSGCCSPGRWRNGRRC